MGAVEWGAWHEQVAREVEGKGGWEAFVAAYFRYLRDDAFEAHGWNTRVFMRPSVYLGRLFVEQQRPRKVRL
jgi:hypothetical protein